MAAAARVSTKGEKEGGEGAEGRGGASYPPGGGPRSEGAAEEDTATRLSWRQWFPCHHREEGGERELTGGPTCQDFHLFPFSKIIPVGFR